MGRPKENYEKQAGLTHPCLCEISVSTTSTASHTPKIQLALAYICRYMDDGGLPLLSTKLRISDVQRNLLGCRFLKQYTWFVLIRSFAISTWNAPTSVDNTENQRSPGSTKSNQARQQEQNTHTNITLFCLLSSLEHTAVSNINTPASWMCTWYFFFYVLSFSSTKRSMRSPLSFSLLPRSTKVYHIV